MAKDPTLEDMIRAAAKNGEITHLSVCAVAGKGPKGISWSAAYSPASQWGQGFGRHDDPVEALKLAMLDDRLRKLSNKLRTTLAKAPDNPKAVRAIKENLPEEVDDSELL